MPTAGRAPAVVPIPELSDEEQQERVADLAKAIQLHQGIREKVSKILPQFDAILRDFARLQDHCSRSQTLRLARLGRILQYESLGRFVLGARFMLLRLRKASEHAERNAGDIEKVILDPSIIPSDRGPKRKKDAKK